MFGRLIIRLGLAACLLAGAANALTGPRPAERPAASVMHRVEPGETLWTIAQAIDPRGDPRPVVDELMALNGLASPAIFAGQRLEIPASA